MISSIRVAYLGPEGTYSHQATATKFKDRATYVPYDTITSTLESVCRDEVEYACIPLENSLHGSVIETLDLLRVDRSVRIMGECSIGIEHCLVARRGVEMGDIQRVLSHEQALGQCRKFLSTHLPSATQIRTPSTASAAQQLLQLDDSTAHHSAAICSRICADSHDELEVLKSSIQDGEINFTRFIVLSKISIPSELQPDVTQRAMLRCVLPPQADRNPYFTLSSIVKALPPDVELARVDRRPSLSREPFHDCTFLELVCQKSLLPRADSGRVWRDRIVGVVNDINRALSSSDIPCCYILGAW